MGSKGGVVREIYHGGVVDGAGAGDEAEVQDMRATLQSTHISK